MSKCTCFWWRVTICIFWGTGLTMIIVGSSVEHEVNYSSYELSCHRKEFHYHQFRVCFMLYLHITLIQNGQVLVHAGVIEVGLAVGLALIVGFFVSNYSLLSHILSNNTIQICYVLLSNFLKFKN